MYIYHVRVYDWRAGLQITPEHIDFTVQTPTPSRSLSLVWTPSPSTLPRVQLVRNPTDTLPSLHRHAFEYISSADAFAYEEFTGISTND